MWQKFIQFFFYFENSSKHQESATSKKMLMDMHSKKIVSFSDNIDEQFKQSAASVAVVASNAAINNEPKEAEMPPPPNKWFRSLSYDHANDQSLKEEEIRNHDLPEAKTMPNESTPKQNNNSMKSPVSMASKYQSVLSINNQEKNLDAHKKLECKQNRRSTSLDWSSRKKLNQNNKNNLASKVASSAKITVCKNSESEENPAFYRLQNDNNNLRNDLVDATSRSNALKDQVKALEATISKLNSTISSKDALINSKENESNVRNNQQVLSLTTSLESTQQLLKDKLEEIDHLKDCVRRECEERTEMLIEISELKDQLNKYSNSNRKINMETVTTASVSSKSNSIIRNDIPDTEIQPFLKSVPSTSSSKSFGALIGDDDDTNFNHPESADAETYNSWANSNKQRAIKSQQKKRK
jgi:predicted  nucleic acid-binding Zn-ribbon protein